MTDSKDDDISGPSDSSEQEKEHFFDPGRLSDSPMRSLGPFPMIDDFNIRGTCRRSVRRSL
jgi:hypothetical protein